MGCSRALSTAGSVLGTCAKGKLTAPDGTRDALADGPRTLRNIWSKFLNDACEIVTYDSAILGLLEYTSKTLP